MSSVNQVTLPANFFDITSAKLLTQPEPQYLYAMLALAALNSDLEGADGPMGHVGREIAGSGAAYASVDAGRLKLAESIMTSAVATPIEPSFKGLPGMTVRFNRPKYTDSTYTFASREIGPDQTISTTPMGLTSEQASMTLKRYAGPYGTGVQPYGIDRLAAEVGVHKLPNIVGHHMKRDYHKTLNSFMNTLYDLGTAIYAGSATSDDTLGAAGANWLTAELLLRVQKTMDEANLPTFPDGHRLLTLPPTGVMQLQLDDDFRLQAQYFKEVNAIFATYIKSFAKFHIVQMTTLTTATNASSNTVYTGHAIAPEGLGVAAGEPARVAYSNDDNYGETAKVIWVGYHSFAELDNRFTYAVKFGA